MKTLKFLLITAVAITGCTAIISVVLLVLREAKVELPTPNPISIKYENPHRVSKSVWKVDALSNDEPRGKRLQNWKDKSKANRKTIQISE